MNRHRRFKLAVLATIVLLAAGSVVTWRLVAAPPGGGVTGPRDPARAAALAPEEPVPGGPGFYAQSAVAFRPLSSSYLWAYYLLELYNPGSGGAEYDLSLSLPNNVTITQFVVYYYDGSSYDLESTLVRCPSAGGPCTHMALVNSSGVPSYSYAATSSIAYPGVDQQNYSYVVDLYLPPAGDSLTVASVRIDYAYQVNLPLLTKDH
jgi:hypothetical protein